MKVQDGFLLIGSTDFFTYGPSRGLVIKTNHAGELKWGRSYYRTDGWVDIVSAVATKNNGAVVAGTFAPHRGIGASYDAYLMRINSNGAIEWKRSYTGKKANAVFALSVTRTSDDGFVLVGNIRRGANQPDDGLLLKVNPSGKTIWSRSYGGSALEQLEFINSTNDGGMIGIGNYAGIYPFIFKLNSAGLMESCGPFETADFLIKFPRISVSTTSISGIALNLRLQNVSVRTNTSSPPVDSFCDKREE